LQIYIFAFASENFFRNINWRQRDKDIVQEYFDLNPQLEGSLLNFSYFQPLISSGSIEPYEVMMQCFINGSAAFMKYNLPGIDLLIPLILTDGRMSFLGVQVKLNRSNGCAKSCFVPIYERMKFSRMFGVCSSPPNDRLMLY
jgi:hypothetical protein